MLDDVLMGFGCDTEGSGHPEQFAVALPNSSFVGGA